MFQPEGEEGDAHVDGVTVTNNEAVILQRDQVAGIDSVS